jgi:hypothetical protein
MMAAVCSLNSKTQTETSLTCGKTQHQHKPLQALPIFGEELVFFTLQENLYGDL